MASGCSASGSQWGAGRPPLNVIDRKKGPPVFVVDTLVVWLLLSMLASLVIGRACVLGGDGPGEALG